MQRRPSIDPVIWHPPAAPPRTLGRDTPTLPPLRLLHVNGLGPEDVAVDGKGHVITGVDGGRILRLSPDGREIAEIANTGGRPLGIEVLADGALLVCDAYRGLLRIEPEAAEIEILADQVDGAPMQFCKNAAAASDGTIYFTDASRRFGLHNWKADLMEHSGTGRLLRRSPDGVVDVLLDGLQLANGVAITPDETAVVVAETGGFQLTRYWLTGPQAGTSQPLAAGLPGYPWGLSTGSDGLIWVALASPHNRVLDQLSRAHPRLRKIVWALPEQWHPKPVPSIAVLALDPDRGTIVWDLFDFPRQEFLVVTGVREQAGTVYLGSVVTRAIAACRLEDAGQSRPPAPPAPPGSCGRPKYPV
ncbi:MAG TPA: SMP-30/gluconolactonase/LRE family protein [Streptosporangiaceae bacterium]|nr:SMP-30/gluconolactonase/LRE family protein [Streptosporangiaceae bacterium]